MNGLRQIMTPSGPILVSEEEAASLGFGDPAPVPQDFGAPTLPAPQESPVPDVAFQPPPIEQGPPPSADVVSGAAPIVPTAPPPGPAPVAVDPAAPAPGPAPASASAQPIDLTKLSHGDIIQQQQANLNEQGAAQAKVGEKEAQSLEQQAAVMEQRNQAIAAKEAADAEAAAKEQAAIAQKSKLWEAKNDEWMNAKVTRRGISTGELIGMAIAGLGSALKGQGGQNPAIPIVMAKIQQDVDDQIRERDELGKQAGQLKGAVDYAREVASDAHAQRLAATGMVTQRYAREVETIAAKMQPGIKREQVQAQAAELKGQGLQLVAQGKERQDQVDARNAQLAQAERDSKRQAGVGYARIAEDKRQANMNAGFRLAEHGRALANDQLDHQEKIGALQARAAAAAKSGNEEARKQAEHDLKLEQDKRERSVPIMRQVAVKDPQTGKVIGQDFKTLTQADGKTQWLAPDQKRAQEIGKKGEALIQYVDAIDRMQQLRNDHGSEWFKTAAAREMMVNYQHAVVRMKDSFGLGALSGPDQALAQGAIGTDNPNEWRKIDAGIQESRKRQIADFNTTLRSNGYTGEPFDIANLTSQGLQSEADLGEAGGRVKALEKDSRAGVRFTGEGGGIAGMPVPAGQSVRLTKDEAPQVANLIAGAQSGDNASRAALAKLAKDRTLGKAVMVEIARSDLDLSDKMSPDEWEMVRIVRGVGGKGKK